jgi:hypothetical protein
MRRQATLTRIGAASTICGEYEPAALKSAGQQPNKRSIRMITRSHLLRLCGASAAALCLAAPALAQNTIKIGELNSYKAQPAFLDPYKKGWEMAVE